MFYPPKTHRSELVDWCLYNIPYVFTNAEEWMIQPTIKKVLADEDQDSGG